MGSTEITLVDDLKRKQRIASNVSSDQYEYNWSWAILAKTAVTSQWCVQSGHFIVYTDEPHNIIHAKGNFKTSLDSVGIKNFL